MIDRIRPLSLGELLDATFRLYRSNAGRFITLAALVLVPSNLLLTPLLTALWGDAELIARPLMLEMAFLQFWG